MYILTKDGQMVDAVSTHLLPEKTQRVFEAIKSANAASFALPEAVALMSEYHLEKIKANSSVKSDIEAIIQDRLISQSRPVGSSIKSQIGGASTLLNASRRTSFVYRVHNLNGGLSEVNNIGGSRKMRDRLRAIAEADGVLEFSHVKDAVFAQNMRIIDTTMPDLLVNMLIDYYSGRGATMMQLCASSGAKGLYGLGVAEISYKVKSFCGRSHLAWCQVVNGILGSQLMAVT